MLFSSCGCYVSPGPLGSPIISSPLVFLPGFASLPHWPLVPGPSSVIPQVAWSWHWLCTAWPTCALLGPPVDPQPGPWDSPRTPPPCPVLTCAVKGMVLQYVVLWKYYLHGSLPDFYNVESCLSSQRDSSYTAIPPFAWREHIRPSVQRPAVTYIDSVHITRSSAVNAAIEIKTHSTSTPT